MILVDTSIIIDFWRKPSEEMKKVFLREDTAICGVTKAELMHGAKSEKDLRIIVDSLKEFRYIPLDESIWDDLGTLLYKLKKKGITVPFQDALIGTLAIEHNLLLWSNDKHFTLIKDTLDNLRLFTL